MNYQVSELDATVHSVRAAPVGDAGARFLPIPHARFTLAPSLATRPGSDRGHLFKREGAVGDRGARPAGRVTSDQMTRRQIMGAVRHGRMVTAYLPGGLTVSGYVFGIDDYRLMIVTPGVSTWLIPKSAPLNISTQSTYDQEPERERLEKMVAPFRDRKGEEPLVVPAQS